ncbi:BTAD domain-containing putative transcriptional regulator [Saccharothrix obliqua]|uniref:BTAD domain-containing putative transcriptional regulator n=1 Tax=Saccharothrix obliqua TaxID=2861747 RepID=UPI001C5F9A82|nr:BTAD domain-containing putative transcriptional regulator [Saccharothrix obliqua]MBW4716816.1 AAA family ATPase [Saccharothrix obliqua]
MEFGVLGPLSADRPDGPVDLRGPRHRAVLARLLVAGGRVVPVTRLVDDLWTDPPEGAVGAIQSFVFTLRRALEPDRPARTPPRLLVTAAPGYALRTDDVDAVRFEAALRAADDPDPAVALAAADAALALWRGPAYAEFADQPWARGEAARLDELRLLAVERRVAAVLALGRPAEAVADLEAHLAGSPWREGAWRLLALALYRSGRQADALAALRRARRSLAEELGVDPGPELRRLEADILDHAPHLLPAPTATRPFFGRAAEVDRLLGAAADVAARRRVGLALVSGDAGAGKTALAEEVAARLRWTTAWRRNQEHGGPAEPPPVVGPGPVLLVVDDLHWAGEDVLTWLTSLLATPPGTPVLVVGTYRTAEVSAALREALGRFARAEPVRVYLGGLPEADVVRLVRVTADRAVDDATARAVHRRSGGNPFFARELARLLDTEGVAALTAVPENVRDVIRRREAALSPEHRRVLRQAAVLGRDVDLDLLVAVAGDEAAVLDAVESAQLLGFVTERGPDEVRFAHDLVRDTLYADTPAARRARWHTAAAEEVERTRPTEVEVIAHHHVRAESRATAGKAAYYARMAAERAERRFAPHEALRWWRAAVAAHDRAGGEARAELETAQDSPGGDARAGVRGSPGGDARAGLAGPESVSGPGSSGGDVRARLAAVTGLVRALAVTGDLAGARRYRAEALRAAERLGDPALTAAVVGAFDVPANWPGNDDQELADHVVAVAERTLGALEPDQRATRARLLGVIALETRGAVSPRAAEAAREAEAIARELDDPALLAFALNGRFMQSFDRAGRAPDRVRIGHELLAVAQEHGLVAFEVLGRLVLLQAHSALAELGAADRHAEAVDRLAAHHELPLVGVFTEWYAALRLAVAGEDAEPAYRAAAARLGGAGMAGLEAGILPFALLCQRVQSGRPVEPAGDWGPYLPWARAVELLAAGRPDEARAAVRESPRDLLYEARTCLTATVALAAGDRDLMRHVYAGLLPAAGELAGAGSGLLTLGPVAGYLGRLAVALDLPDAAEAHFRRAREVARKAGAPHWEN